MREPSLQKTTVLSLVLHISVLFIALLLLRQSNKLMTPSPYVVSLVTSEVSRGKDTDIRGSKEAARALKDTSAVEAVPKKAITKKDMTKEDMKKKNEKKEEMVEDRIAAIAAKKKVEKLVKLRSEISLKAGSNLSKDGSGTSPAQAGKQSLFDEYYTEIRKEIWHQWVFPDFGRKDLEAVIAIRIMKDGTISIQKIEKSSGNSFFDKSAIKALTKASPLSPPPYEMEIGVKFYP